MPANRAVIRASEIGEYIYCHRAWWLHRVCGLESANREQLQAGVVRHAEHGRAVQSANTFQRVALVLFLLAMVFAIAFAVTLTTR